MTVPAEPKIYHILHVDRLPSIVDDGCLWCDSEVIDRSLPGTSIGLSHIKKRRLEENQLKSHPGLFVGNCVPFYFCPRSVMLYILYKADTEGLGYRRGQSKIVHLEADFRETVAWAESEGLRWAFTRTNAGSYYFEDWATIKHLDAIDWDAVAATDWRGQKEGKQAEFLVELRFPWQLVNRIGTHTLAAAHKVRDAIEKTTHRPTVEVRPDWYY